MRSMLLRDGNIVDNENGVWRDMGEDGPATGVVTVSARAATAGVAPSVDLSVETNSTAAPGGTSTTPLTVTSADAVTRVRLLLQRFVRFVAANHAPAGAQAALTTALAGLNDDLTYTAIDKGLAGNSITVAYINPGTPNAALSVVTTGSDIVVNLATNGASAITSTAAQVAAAVAADVLGAAKLVTVANAGGNDGTGVVSAMAATPLSGGTDPGTFPVDIHIDFE